MVYVYECISTFYWVPLSAESFLHHDFFYFNTDCMVVEAPPDLVRFIINERIVMSRLCTPIVDHNGVEVVRELAVISECVLNLVLQLQNSRFDFNAALLDCLMKLGTHVDRFGKLHLCYFGWQITPRVTLFLFRHGIRDLFVLCLHKDRCLQKWFTDRVLIAGFELFTEQFNFFLPLWGVKTYASDSALVSL